MALNRDYSTLVGFVLERVGHLPEEGEAFNWIGWRFEVFRLDGRRIDEVRAQPKQADRDGL